MVTRNLESKELVKMPYNAFEQLYGLQGDTRLLDAVNVLVDSYQNPSQLPFAETNDFCDNLQLLEKTTLVRVENMQNLQQMTSKQTGQLNTTGE